MRLFGVIYENGKLTTGFLAKRIKRIPIVGEAIYGRIVAVCGAVGHVPGDWGFGGGDKVDCWCRRCDHLQQIPSTEAVKLFPGIRGTVFDATGQDMNHWHPTEQ